MGRGRGQSMRVRSCCFTKMVLMLLLLGAGIRARADGPGDNSARAVRPVPPPGIEVPPERKAVLEERLKRLGTAIQQLRERTEGGTLELLPDVEIFHKAVQVALEQREFFAPGDLDKAEQLLAEGQKRAEQLARKESPWTNQTGLVVRGYVSRIDGSVQPYGLVVPASYDGNGSARHRLDIWFHGRGETVTELNFVDQRMRQPGQFTPAHTFVLHPFGRYCNAFRFAGEVDVLEALESTQKRYKIDEDRVSVRGFSMGGAGCWQFATHYSDRWFAANPGAGFAETRLFLETFQNETLEPTWYERKLWRLYDCTDWSLNLKQCPTVAYSGEIDRQKQAADVMAEALAGHGITLKHIIGPNTAHKYHPDSAVEVDQIMGSLSRGGRTRVPAAVSFETYSLRYNRMNWLRIDALSEHWERGHIEARLVNAKSSGNISQVSPEKPSVEVTTQGVEALSLQFEPGDAPFELGSPVVVRLNDTVLNGPVVSSDRSWDASFHCENGQWKLGEAESGGLRKRHGLQGPIDDAFMEPFLFVLPTGKSQQPAINAWVEAESRRAIEQWRKQFRGEAQVKRDLDVTPEDLAGKNLVLWGEPSSNTVLKRVLERLPVVWDGERVKLGQSSYEADHHLPILIYPNPENPERYVVLNSGFTYREYDYLNNARQVPKLPDWAILDVRVAPGTRYPGKVAAAGFFGEAWEVKASAESSKP